MPAFRVWLGTSLYAFAFCISIAGSKTISKRHRLRERNSYTGYLRGRMFSHIFVGSDDVATSKKFYDAVLGAIGVPEGKLDAKGRVFYRTPSGTFGISKPIDGNPATHANGGTIGFSCDSPDKVKAFHDAGVASGGKSIEDPPGWREGGAAKLYLAYLRDPFHNKICALHRG
jgi:catechol 2,3-dioxygenase-like lactoylglutathione lyase family enzyme